MRKTILIIPAILILILLILSGCSAEESVETSNGEQAAVDSCVSCHTDKELLIELAQLTPVEVKSEETSGEG